MENLKVRESWFKGWLCGRCLMWWQGDGNGRHQEIRPKGEAGARSRRAAWELYSLSAGNGLWQSSETLPHLWQIFLGRCVQAVRVWASHRNCTEWSSARGNWQIRSPNRPQVTRRGPRTWQCVIADQENGAVLAEAFCFGNGAEHCTIELENARESAFLGKQGNWFHLGSHWIWPA